MKRFLYLLTVLALMVAGCDMRQPLKVGYEAPADQLEETDTTIYGFCGKSSTQDILQIITSYDDTIYINVQEARKKDRVMAGYSRGDEIYVVPNADHSAAVMTINKNCLLGEWVMPSPFDGSTPSGIVIKDGGEASNFEQQGDIIYKSWRILNGHLQLSYTRDDGTDIYSTDTYEILRMTEDSLYLKNMYEEETFEFGRYKPEPEIDLGVILDYNYEEDYNLF